MVGYDNYKYIYFLYIYIYRTVYWIFKSPNICIGLKNPLSVGLYFQMIIFCFLLSSPPLLLSPLFHPPPLSSTLLSSPSLAKFMRRTQAATTIQKFQRMYMERKRYRQKQAAALAMQTILRAYMARQMYRRVGGAPPHTYTHTHTL